MPPVAPSLPPPLRLDAPTAALPATWSRTDAAQFARLRAAADACLPQPQCDPARLAQAAHLSERTLYRRLKELIGLTPAAFLRELRLLRARHLLRTGELPTVGEVACAVGFVNANHFGRVYARRFGRPPGQDKREP